MTRPTSHFAYDEPLTLEQLTRFWQQCDEQLTPDAVQCLSHPQTPGIVLAARCVYTVAVVSILTTLPWALRIIGGA